MPDQRTAAQKPAAKITHNANSMETDDMLLPLEPQRDLSFFLYTYAIVLLVNMTVSEVEGLSSSQI